MSWLILSGCLRWSARWRWTRLAHRGRLGGRPQGAGDCDDGDDRGGLALGGDGARFVAGAAAAAGGVEVGGGEVGFDVVGVVAGAAGVGVVAVAAATVVVVAFGRLYHAGRQYTTGIA